MRERWWLGLTGTSLIIVLLVGFAACPRTSQTRLPLIYGTNMSLYDTSDQMTNNIATQQLLRHERVPIIRMPSRDILSDAYVVQALQAIKSIGAIPLVIVHGANDPNALADDSHLITLVQSVFGDQIVYVEFGNEPNLAGNDVTTYTRAWNQVIPHLKSMAPTYKFVGPVTSDPNAAYIATFDALASPRPDANSWHEYACAPGDPDESCMAHLASWTTHVQGISRAVRAAIGTTLPLMITEWNLDADPDPRYANARFIQAWTTQALQTLAANEPNGLIAAMQYCATNNAMFQLIDRGNHLAPEGQAFFQELELAGKSSR